MYFLKNTTCPYCKSEAIMYRQFEHNGSRWHCIMCNGCKMCGPWQGSYETALEAWKTLTGKAPKETS